MRGAGRGSPRLLRGVQLLRRPFQSRPQRREVRPRRPVLGQERGSRRASRDSGSPVIAAIRASGPPPYSSYSLSVLMSHHPVLVRPGAQGADRRVFVQALPEGEGQHPGRPATRGRAETFGPARATGGGVRHIVV
ncbi:hypothetical protein ABZ800_29190 [Streptomyces sp. NPDC047813]|uniref:hypothetical protein n=1 Tax=Streptomyces sp. NPDC047813 TaxID=3154608 RepID=UPI0033D87BCC